MEEAASPGGLDPARLAEAPRLVGSVSRAIQGLATEIQSHGHVSWARRRGWLMAVQELEVLKVHMLKIWFISADVDPPRAGDKALAKQARDATYLVDGLEDMIQYSMLLSNLAPRAKMQFKLLPALSLRCRWNCLLAFEFSNPNKILRDIKLVNEETGRLGHLLEMEKAAGNPLPPQPYSGKEALQRVLVFGRHKDVNEIMQMLIQPCGKPATDRVISIVGPGGIGKTTLAHMVSNDATVRQHFDITCWVSLSSVSNKMELAAEILRPWNGSAEKMLDFQMLQSELQRSVTSKRYLIILDDVCSGTDESWLDMFTPLQSADIGSRILVTSRMNTVTHMPGASQVYNVKPLTSDDCWALLKGHAFPSDTEYCFRIEDGMKCDIPSTVRHLSVTVHSVPGLTSSRGLEDLRTLLIRPSITSSSSSFQEDLAASLKSILEKSKHLRVLDLSGYNSKELPYSIYDLLHLRYLSIHGSIQRLSESIGKLLHLQTLCITGKCSLEKLPANVSILVNLRHLMVEIKFTAGLVGIG